MGIEQLQLLNTIVHIFIGLSEESNRLLNTLEQRFREFLSLYISNDDWIQQGDVLNNWVYINKLPFSLPVPNEQQLQSEQTNLAAQDVLLLFCYQQLIRYGIFTNKKTLDEQLFYCTGFVEPTEIEAVMNKRQLFVDIGPQVGIFHGDYMHLLQLILICMAQEYGLLELEKFTSTQALPLYLANLQLGYSSSGKLATGWDYTLDHVNHTGCLTGPMGLNILLLSLIATSKCPTLHTYHTKNYINTLQICSETTGKSAEQLIRNNLHQYTNSNQFRMPPIEKFIRHFARKYQAASIGKNMWRAQKRGASFLTAMQKIKSYSPPKICETTL